MAIQDERRDQPLTVLFRKSGLNVLKKLAKEEELSVEDFIYELVRDEARELMIRRAWLMSVTTDKTTDEIRAAIDKLMEDE